MAVHNVEKFIASTLMAIQSQTYKDFECIIVDDNSNDNTINIIYNMFCLRDNRFKLFVNCTSPDNPYVDAHNLSYSFCSGEYIIRLDGDDIPAPTLVERYVMFMDMNPVYDACCSTMIPMWSNSITGILENPRESDELSDDIIHNWFDIFPTDKDTDVFNKQQGLDYIQHCLSWCNPCACIRREYLIKHNLKFKYFKSGDYLFWIEFFAEGGKGFKLKDVLLKYRVHHTSISHNDSWNDVGNYFERDLVLAKLKIIKNLNDPNYNEQIQVLENTVEYFNDLIEREQVE